MGKNGSNENPECAFIEPGRNPFPEGSLSRRIPVGYAFGINDDGNPELNLRYNSSVENRPVQVPVTVPFRGFSVENAALMSVPFLAGSIVPTDGIPFVEFLSSCPDVNNVEFWSLAQNITARLRNNDGSGYVPSLWALAQNVMRLMNTFKLTPLMTDSEGHYSWSGLYRHICKSDSDVQTSINRLFILAEFQNSVKAAIVARLVHSYHHGVPLEISAEILTGEVLSNFKKVLEQVGVQVPDLEAKRKIVAEEYRSTLRSARGDLKRFGITSDTILRIVRDGVALPVAVSQPYEHVELGLEHPMIPGYFGIFNDEPAMPDSSGVSVLLYDTPLGTKSLTYVAARTCPFITNRKTDFTRGCPIEH